MCLWLRSGHDLPAGLQEAADPVLAAALHQRMERWARWPVLLGLALQVRACCGSALERSV